ncbi:MAG: phosphoribosyltransferase family protein [bacterium]|jgi:pyrimidine operon attenuation protein/uracil phosphoribosyltransferase|nr:phosphoribosyltransferase [Chitinophagaceae bacterium]
MKVRQMERKQILTGAHAEMKIRRLAYEILEHNPGERELLLAGIKGCGLVVARQLQSVLSGISNVAVKLISVDLNKEHPGLVTLSESVALDGRVVILVDDVTNSGRTLLYAMRPFLECHPRKIQTLVLVERSHKAYPIHPDFTGLRLATTMQDHVRVEVEGDIITGAYIQ